MEIDYYKKYLKYKAKYIELRDQIGSGLRLKKVLCNRKCCDKNEVNEHCGCKKYKEPSVHSKNLSCKSCGHSKTSHYGATGCTSEVTRTKDCKCAGFESNSDGEKDDDTICINCKHKNKWHNE